MDLCNEDRRSVIGINDSGGARIQEGVVSLAKYGDIFFAQRSRFRCDPADFADHGAVRGWRCLLPAITDFIVMVDKTLPHVHHRSGCHQDSHW